jgi:hypothetical protein
MESVESQIAEWRAYVAKRPAVNGHDVDELEDHLRHVASSPPRSTHVRESPPVACRLAHDWRT